MQIQAGCPTPGTPAACEQEITSRNSTMSKDQTESTECFHFCPLDRRIDFLQIIVQNISREESRIVIFHLPEQLSRKSSRIIKLLFIAQAEIFCSPTHQNVTSTYSDDSYVFGCYTVSIGKQLPMFLVTLNIRTFVTEEEGITILRNVWNYFPLNMV